VYCMICKNTAFCHTLKMFLFKYISSIYFRKFLVITHSTEVTKVHINMLFKLPDIFNFQGPIFIFPNFLCLSIGKVMGHGNHYICYKCCIILPTVYYIRSVQVCHSISYDRPVTILTF